MGSILEASTHNFESDMHELLSSWLALRDPIPETWKPKVNPKDPMRFSDVQELGIKGCIDLVHQARDTAPRLKALSDSLGILSYMIHEKWMAAQENFVALSNMASLITLPNELLSRIFDFVVNGDQSLEIPARQNAAVTLTHVCQYFRDTALSCTHLWSNISGSRKMATLCLSRSKNAPLNVDLPIEYIWRGYPQPFDFALPNRILEDALNYSTRWKSLDMQFTFVRAEDEDLGRNTFGKSEILQAFRALNAPSLESLFLRGESESYGRLTEVLAELESWNAPRIRHITSNHCFPLRLPGLANVTSFNVELDLDEVDLTDVLNHLSRMTALEDLQLTVYSSICDLPLRDEKTTLLGVKRLHINIPYAGDHDYDFDPSSPLNLFLSSLLFPGVVDLRINLDGAFEKDAAADCAETSMVDDIMCIFQHSDQYPKVESFHLKVIGDDGRPPNATPDQIGRISLVVPLGMLPSLKHFEVFSNCHLRFSDDDNGPGDSFFECYPQYSWDSWLPGAPGMASPALETISINVIRVEDRRWCRPVVDFVGDIVQKQKERGDWESFRELVVLSTNKDGAGQTSVYEGDAALQWCMSEESEEPTTLPVRHSET